jgi:gamma-glutamylcyclotransferase (GGCT)/AIG2-like uncharacterized protein YtfP
VSLDRLFVYGTLRRGDVRWPLLERFVVDAGWPDAVRGELFDTGHDYPAAIFDAESPGLITGETYTLLAHSLDDALTRLDEEEGTVEGLYQRVEVTTERGVTAWAYAFGAGPPLTPIPSGDWLTHRPL